MPGQPAKPALSLSKGAVRRAQPGVFCDVIRRLRPRPSPLPSVQSLPPARCSGLPPPTRQELLLESMHGARPCGGSSLERAFFAAAAYFIRRRRRSAWVGRSPLGTFFLAGALHVQLRRASRTSTPAFNPSPTGQEAPDHCPCHTRRPPAARQISTKSNRQDVETDVETEGRSKPQARCANRSKLHSGIRLSIYSPHSNESVRKMPPSQPTASTALDARLPLWRPHSLLRQA